MKLKRILGVCLAAGVGLLALAGCSGSGPAKPANEMTFSLDGISEIQISYDEENITFYESEGGELTIREYMTEYKSSYCAKVEQSGDRIAVSEGGKPFFKGGFSRSIEVYLPASYHENLTVTTTDGDIDGSELALSLNALRMDSTAGTIRLNTVEAQGIHLSTTSGVLNVNGLDADTIRIDTTSGHVSCQQLNGNVTCATTSGNVDIPSAIGSGSYRASQSGQLKIVYTEVTGDLSFFNKNDSIQVTLPSDLEFYFEATTKNGFVRTTFPESISTEGRTTSGTVGAHPTVTVQVETKNGAIEVTQ